MKSFSPWYSLVFLVGIGVLSFGLSSIWPEEHPEFLGLEVKFARPNTFNPIHVDTSSQSVNPEQLLAQYQLNSDSANIDAVISAEEQAELDSVALQAKLEAEAKAAFDRLQIKFADDDTTRLAAFFNALAKEGQSANDIDVLHFGDSQIEGDRISGFVRNKWQERWGGTGPGLVPIVEAVPSAAIRQEATDNFQRYALFGKADKPEHDRFGLLASLSVADFSETSIASFTYKPSRLSYWRTKKYTTGRLFFGECADSCIIRYQLGDSLLRVDSFPRIEGQMNRYFQWSSTPEEFTVEIEGKTSPEFYS
ncbi:MAG: hypothetical protein HRT74_06210, partial [Flavobacteriales bacterium]|nr:hypothetical protein [Flavobacteriales bacterium]